MMPHSLGSTYCTCVLKELAVFVFHFSALKVKAAGSDTYLGNYMKQHPKGTFILKCTIDCDILIRFVIEILKHKLLSTKTK